ncbi:MAG: ComF family protein [Paludibacteraceae bacterium]|nr:ComF family protein [Paludibacteraceae bacterium]
MFSSLWHLINPRLCPMCGRVLYMDEDEICGFCVSKLPLTEHALRRDNSVELTFADENKFVRGGAFCYYRHGEPFTEAVHAMKYGSRPEVGLALGRIAGHKWKDSGFFDDMDMIIPLPLHRKRLHDRGYNQSEWIARGLCETIGLPIVTDCLIRTVNNAQQAFMSHEERRQLSQIFEVHNESAIRGKHILLVDDVMTTGSTLRRAIHALHPIRRCTVSVFVLARAVNKKYAADLKDEILHDDRVGFWV